MIIWDARIADWVATHLGEERGFGPNRDFGPCQALGVVKDGVLKAGVVYHGWQPQSETIQFSAFSTDRRWTTPEIVTEIFEYPFSFCQMLWAQSEVDNIPRAIFRKLGGNEMVVPRLLGRDRDGVLLTLTDDQWRATRYARKEDNEQTVSPQTA